jgi:excisionase family DNA binding protein
MVECLLRLIRRGILMENKEKTPIGSREAAKILGVTPKTILRMVERGEIAGWRAGDVWRFFREDIVEFRDSQLRGKQR